MEKEYRKIEGEIDEEIQLIRRAGAHAWEVGEVVAYFSSRGEYDLGEIIRPAYPRVLKKIELTTQGEKITKNKVVVAPREAFDER